MVLPLPRLTRCGCLRLLLPPWPPAPHGSRGCRSQNLKKASPESSSTGSGETKSPPRGARPQRSGSGSRAAELAQAEEMLEQQLELYQALLEGREGAWEAQALVLKIQKLKEQMRRHQESLRGEA